MVLTFPNAETLSYSPRVVVTPTTTLFVLLLNTCNFATVINCNVDIYVSEGLKCYLWKGCSAHRLRTSPLAFPQTAALLMGESKTEWWKGRC